MRGLKVGDIFEVQLDRKKQFLQYLATDKSCLSGHVVRAFDFELGLNEACSLDELVVKPVKFYTHTILHAGEKLKVWKKIGNVPIQKTFKLPYFRHTEDARDPRIKKSKKWYIWEVNGPFLDIGELTDEYSSLDVGGLTHPLDIVKRLRTGKDVLEYPL